MFLPMWPSSCVTTVVVRKLLCSFGLISYEIPCMCLFVSQWWAIVPVCCLCVQDANLLKMSEENHGNHQQGQSTSEHRPEDNPNCWSAVFGAKLLFRPLDVHMECQHLAPTSSFWRVCCTLWKQLCLHVMRKWVWSNAMYSDWTRSFISAGFRFIYGH
jgi:hypothetical protein